MPRNKYEKKSVFFATFAPPFRRFFQKQGTQRKGEILDSTNCSIIERIYSGLNRFHRISGLFANLFFNLRSVENTAEVVAKVVSAITDKRGHRTVCEHLCSWWAGRWRDRDIGSRYIYNDPICMQMAAYRTDLSHTRTRTWQRARRSTCPSSPPRFSPSSSSSPSGDSRGPPPRIYVRGELSSRGESIDYASNDFSLNARVSSRRSRILTRYSRFLNC